METLLAAHFVTFHPFPSAARESVYAAHHARHCRSAADAAESDAQLTDYVRQYAEMKLSAPAGWDVVTV